MNGISTPIIEIINTGSELMLGYVLNTHQQWLCRQFSERGYVVHQQIATTDSGPDIQGAVRDALTRANLIITTGGLGPTSDDRTRDMIAQLLGTTLVEDEQILRHIEEFFGRRKRAMPSSVRVQALVPKGATVLMNRQGTAPGLAINTPQALLIMLPGPPRELRPMFTEQALPLIEQRFGKPPGFECRVLRTVGIGESFVEERIAAGLAPLIAQGLEVGYCARVGEVDVRLIGRGATACELVQQAETQTRNELRSFIYGVDPEQLDSVLVRTLTQKSKTLALAESCTGGYLSNRITNIPGASAVFLGGIVSYSNQAKEYFLGVDPALIQQHGAVSEQVARQMAEGARRTTGADYALAITGIAGPSGGTDEKPVGTVFVALASTAGVEVKRFLNQYDRETFKFLTSQQAFDLLRHHLMIV